LAQGVGSTRRPDPSTACIVEIDLATEAAKVMRAVDRHHVGRPITRAPSKKAQIQGGLMRIDLVGAHGGLALQNGLRWKAAIRTITLRA